MHPTCADIAALTIARCRPTNHRIHRRIHVRRVDADAEDIDLRAVTEPAPYSAEHFPLPLLRRLELLRNPLIRDLQSFIEFVRWFPAELLPDQTIV